MSRHTSRRLACHLALLVTVGLPATVFTCAAAAAQGAGFEALDKNSDGKISLDEASADDKLFVAFKRLDMDKSGTLSKAEFEKYDGK
ncbi:MAG TPA: hypothetical protein VGN07_12415 [Steroidobacteraceae bacterium]|jgi:hypothetical protein